MEPQALAGRGMKVLRITVAHREITVATSAVVEEMEERTIIRVMAPLREVDI